MLEGKKMEKSNKKKISFKIIAAGITLLLGIILAIGYPTGGVKADYSNRQHVVVKHTTTKQTGKTHLIKKQETRKRVNIPVTPPTANDESGDEGC